MWLLSRDRTVRNGSWARCAFSSGSFRPALVMLGVAGLLGSAPALAGAEEVQVVPTLSLRQQFTDNYRYTSRMEDAATTTVIPGIELGVKTERLEASASALVECQTNFVRDEGYLGAVNQNYNGSFSYLTSTTTQVSGRASYLDQPSPERPLAVNGVLISPARLSQQAYGGSGGWRISELLGSSIQYDYSRYDYSPPTASINTTNAISTGLTYELEGGSISQATLTAGLARYSFDSATQQSLADNYYLTVGANHVFSERWRVSADAGGRYTHSNYSLFSRNIGFGPASVSDGLGFIAHLNLNYHTDRSSADLIVKHDLEPGSGSTAVTNTTAVYLTASHRYSEDFSTSLMAGYTKRTTGQINSAIQGANEDVISISTGVNYTVTPDLAAGVSYTYSRTFYGAPSPDVYQNMVYVGLTWKRNLFD